MADGQASQWGAELLACAGVCPTHVEGMNSFVLIQNSSYLLRFVHVCLILHSSTSNWRWPFIQAEIGCGISIADQQRAAASDERWQVSGRWGVVQIGGLWREGAFIVDEMQNGFWCGRHCTIVAVWYGRWITYEKIKALLVVRRSCAIYDFNALASLRYTALEAISPLSHKY